MSVTHYQGSRGPVEIATMPFTYAQNARDKLVREQIGDERQEEIDALGAHLKAMDDARKAEEAAKATDPAEIEGALAAADLEGFF